MMRYLLSLFFLLVTVSALHAQKANVQSAGDALRLKDIEKAKKFIDEAATTESTANDPKMWYYRGKVYQAVNDDKVISQTDQDAAEKATVSFLNCIRTDTKKNYSDSTAIFTWIAGYSLYNRAVEAYSKGDPERAARYYTTVLEVFQHDKDNNMKRNNITPDIVTKNLYLCAHRQKDFVKAKGYLQKLIDIKFNDPTIYLNMSRILLDEKDTSSALEYVTQGRQIFEEYQGLINQEIAIYIAQGKSDILIDRITNAMVSNEDNESLFFMRGVLYEQKKEAEKAIPDYLKALEIKEDYWEASYNIGNLYFGQAAAMVSAANALPKDKIDEFAKSKEKIDQKLKESQPYLEKAKELNPKKTDDEISLYQTTLNLLKQLYARTNQMDKYNEVKTEIEGKK